MRLKAVHQAAAPRDELCTVMCPLCTENQVSVVCTVPHEGLFFLESNAGKMSADYSGFHQNDPNSHLLEQNKISMLSMKLQLKHHSSKNGPTEGSSISTDSIAGKNLHPWYSFCDHERKMVRTAAVLLIKD